MAELVRSAVMAFWPDGGQGTARRNAWAAMVADARRARERTEVDTVMSTVAAVHEATAIGAAVSHG